jgi:hypothetical protein
LVDLALVFELEGCGVAVWEVSSFRNRNREWVRSWEERRGVERG